MFWGDGYNDIDNEYDVDDARQSWGKVYRWRWRTRTAWRGLMTDGGFVRTEYHSGKGSATLARRLYRAAIRLVAHWIYRRGSNLTGISLRMLRYLDLTAERKSGK